MRRILCCALALTALATSSAHAADAAGNLTVLADSSLALPLTQLARDYTHSSGNAITIVILGPNDTAQQIAQGIDANVLITANAPLLDALNARGLVDVFGKHAVARTQLALAAPVAVARDNNLATRISFTAMLYAQPNLPVYVTAETTLEGGRARQLMKNSDYSAPLLARTVSLDDHAAVMEKLAQKPGFTLMLATDALREPSLKILNIVPDDVAEPVNYQAVLVAGAELDASRNFMDYLASSSSQSVLNHYGFQSP